VNKKQTKREMKEVVWRSEMLKSMKDDVDSKSPILYLTYRDKVQISENCMSENEYVSTSPNGPNPCSHGLPCRCHAFPSRHEMVARITLEEEDAQRAENEGT
jgi:hypothetical protein